MDCAKNNPSHSGISGDQDPWFSLILEIFMTNGIKARKENFQKFTDFMKNLNIENFDQIVQN